MTVLLLTILFPRAVLWNVLEASYDVSGGYVNILEAEDCQGNFYSW